MNGLIVEHLAHAYGKSPVLQDITLRVSPGTVHCLVGPSGSGKSTLLRNIAGLERPTTGTIYLHDELLHDDTRSTNPEERRIGYLFQDFALFPNMNVARNVAFGMTEKSRPAREDRITALLAQVQMSDFRDAMPSTLSGGEQQRVALARALACNPRLVLLDEPFSGLDATLRREVRTLTLELLRESQTPTLMVTHDPQEALTCGDVVSVIKAGCILQTASPFELYYYPQNKEIASIFDRINEVPVSWKDGQAICPLGAVPERLWEHITDDVILVRPDSVMLSPPRKGDDLSKVTDVEWDGGFLLVTVETPGGHRLLARCPGFPQVSIGDAVRAHLA
ncbi:MAG: ABC transporter ATP-binding protein [Pirellulaceae bacterium]|nr:ABC transporter ATP-binding protein [Pirellulaceae bacterium]